MSKNRVIFFIHPCVHILDLAGAVQAFYEAGDYGHPYEIFYVSTGEGQCCSAGLQLAKLADYATLQVMAGDVVIVPGYDMRKFARGYPSDRSQAMWDQPARDPSGPGRPGFHQWLVKAEREGATIGSICNGAFILAEAGLLNGKECTTHWKYTGLLQKDFPLCRVLTNRLFVRSGNIYTSAGVTTGTDMALHLLEERHGPEFAYRVAREMVVYIRRDGTEPQDSVYLQYRSHIHDEVHRVQDWISGNLHRKITLSALAELIPTSSRNLTRLFKATTGITIGQYVEKLRAEKAAHLLKQGDKLGHITRQCGLQSPNQLRHILHKHTGRLPSGLKV